MPSTGRRRAPRRDHRHEHERERRGQRVVAHSRNWFWTTLPIICWSAGCRGAAALTKSPAAGMNVSRLPGEHAGQRERQHHLPERAPRRGVQVRGRVDQAAVDLLEADVDRQHHERQEVVGEAADHGERGVEQRAPFAESRWSCAAAAPTGPSSLQDRLPREACAPGSVVKNGTTTSPSSRFLNRPPGRRSRRRAGSRSRAQSSVARERVAERAEEMGAVVAERRRWYHFPPAGRCRAGDARSGPA